MHFKRYNELSLDELYAMLQLRSEVFVVEQDSVYQDVDGFDGAAVHLLHYRDDKLVAYGRICPAGTVHENLSFGRLVIKKDCRGTGLGKAMVVSIMDYIAQHFAGEAIKLDAQEYLQPWYEHYGFVATGEPYDWGGIMHVPMQRGA